MFTRRQFIKGLLAGMALSALNPLEALAADNTGKPILVAVHLTGGNDALNTLVPFKEAVYRKSRPNLAIGAKELLTVDKDLALHPSLNRLHKRYQEGQVLLVPGVGREDHDRSHFRSSDIWHGAGHPGGDGWLASLGLQLKSTPVSIGPSVSRAVACPDHPPVGLVGEKPAHFPADKKLQQVWFDMYRDWQADHSAGRRLKKSAAVVEELTTRLESQMAGARLLYPFADDEFGKRFEMAYRLIASGFPAQLLHLSMGSFDTHSDQLENHAKQLSRFDAAAHAFLENIKSLGRPTTIMVYSEFGRRVAENFSGGTDHGAGGLAWIMGDNVKGGLHGHYQLEDLRDGDLPTVVNYRTLYGKAVAASFGEQKSLARF